MEVRVREFVYVSVFLLCGYTYKKEKIKYKTFLPAVMCIFMKNKKLISYKHAKFHYVSSESVYKKILIKNLIGMYALYK